MDAIGSQEMLAPVLTPAELWETTGRYGIPEIFKLKDRSGRDFVLPLTHEETFTFHAREIQSYKQLPQLWYHFQTKDRDEPRPRGGLLRVREFIMKDSYSFDRDEAGLDESFELNRGGVRRGSSSAAGSRRTTSQAESGMMGGSESFDFLAPSGSGENTLVTCENGDYAADLEIAHGDPARADVPAAARRARGGRDAGRRRRSRRSPQLLDIDEAATSKAMPYTKADGTVVLALVRGDDRLEEAKLLAALGADARPSTDEEIRAAFGAEPRLARPGRLRGRGDRRRDAARGAVRRRREPRPAGICAASRRDATSSARFADICACRRRATAARSAAARSRSRPRSRSATSSSSARSYSEPLGATFLDEDGQEKPLVMGSLRHRPGPRHGRGRRAAPRRERDRLAARDRAVRRARRRARRAPRRSREQAARGALGGRARRPARRPRPARRARSSPTPT